MADVPYRFERFQRQLLGHDLSFEAGAEPGEVFPDFQLLTVDGPRVKRDELTAQRPMLMVFSSFT